MGGGKGGGGDVTIGFRYFAGFHLIFCHALDRLLKIRAGEKTAWEGSLAANTQLMIDKPELFGGESREGGVRGLFDICFGGPTQPQNDYLQSILGANIPAYRGLFGLIGRKPMVSANNPYIKEYSILGERVLIDWRDDLAAIVASDGYNDMNAAHMIYECLTNTTWGGLGYPVADMNVGAFQAVANTLHAEGFGLSLVWAKNSSIEDFIKIILDHIDGVLYPSPSTGLVTLKLIRDDTAPLVTFDQSNVLNLVEFSNPAATEVVNQVTLKYIDRDNNACGVTVQDMAGISRMAGQVNAVTINMFGIADAELAARVAARELTQLCLPLSTCTLEVNRKHSHLEPGDTFIWNWPPLGISNLTMRVADIEFSAHSSSVIRVKAVRDVFGMTTASFTAPSYSMWTRPENDPADATYRKVTEITWWQFVKEYAGESDAVLAELNDDSTLVICYCNRPSGDALNYEMWTRNTGAADYEKKDIDSFPFVSFLDADVAPEVESILTLAGSHIDTDLVQPGQYADLDGEMVAVISVDVENNQVTVSRGVLDTIPVTHLAGATIWFHQGLFGLDRTERVEGESVEVKILPSTSLGRLALDDAAVNSYTTDGRMMRPYPPGNVKVNGSRWPASIGATDELTITWAHRDRTLQTVTLNRQDEGNIGPESGVTYTLRIYGESDTLLRTITGLTGTSYTYLQADEEVDSGFVPARLNTGLRFEMESVRDGLASLQKWDVEVARV